MRSACAATVANAGSSSADISNVDSSRGFGFMLSFAPMASVRRKCGVEESRQPAHAVGAVDHALARVADVRVGDLIGGDRVVGGNVCPSHHPRHMHEFIALIELQGLVALNHE